MSGRGRVIASPAIVDGDVRAGAIAPIGSKGVPSGFVKQPLTGTIRVTERGVSGDEQADLRVHGGRDKAVYAYPSSAYPRWRDAAPRHAARLVPGAMGENLTIAGWSDGDVAIGDTVRIGTALLQVTEPRQPCYKLALAFGDGRMVRLFMAVGISGWYYRVLEPGVVAAGDAATCLARPNPAWTIARFFALIASGSIDDEALAEIVALEGVADGWRLRALRLLARRASGDADA